MTWLIKMKLCHLFPVWGCVCHWKQLFLFMYQDGLFLESSRETLQKEMTTHSSIVGLENVMDRGAWQATVHGVAGVRRDLTSKLPWERHRQLPLHWIPLFWMSWKPAFLFGQVCSESYAVSLVSPVQMVLWWGCEERRELTVQEECGKKGHRQKVEGQSKFDPDKIWKPGNFQHSICACSDS